MGGLIGFAFGFGLLLIWWSWTWPAPTDRERAPRRRSLPARLGVEGVTGKALAALTFGAFLIVFLVMAVVSRSLPVAAVFALLAAGLPIANLRGKAIRRRREHAELWPDAVDNLASAVRAGLSLPEALQQLGERGPEPLRAPFVAFGRDYQVSGRFHEALDLLKARLADPVGDRVVEAIRIAREVGGGDLGRMLRALSGFLRDDLRTRGELESRQSWTVNGARMAVAAPWLVLLLMSFERDVISRFSSGMGLVILGVGAATCVGAYRLMMWIGRMPMERRILA